jgi:uncharacterized membrane protein YidH (DUF202 family)
VSSVKTDIAARWEQLYPSLSVTDALAFERTLLAAQRTYLAFMRTSLAVGLAGLTAASLSTQIVWRLLGGTAAIVSAGLVFYATRRANNDYAEWLKFARFAGERRR